MVDFEDPTQVRPHGRDRPERLDIVSFQLSLSTESVTAAYPEPPLIVAPDTTVGEVLQLLRTERTASVLICDDSTRVEDVSRKTPVGADGGRADGGRACGGRACGGRVGSMVGIFTERDALIWNASGQPLDRPVSEAMSSPPVAVTDEATVGQAIQKMAEGGYRHLPILAADGTPVGMAVVHGIVHYLVDHFPETIYTLPPTPDSVPSEREGA